MHQASVTIFPSITPAATTTIITGAYPAEHGIAGASWYDAAREEVAYYGDDFWVIAREGLGDFVNDFLLRLNGDRLRAPTLFELIERSGRTAACLNYLVFRGNYPHRVDMPGVMAALPGVPLSETVEGPSHLALGDFVRGCTSAGRRLAKRGGLLHRFGMDDESTGALLRDLMGNEGLPDFTVAYFADNDYRSHKVGPVAALPVIERIDRMLGDAFEAAGGLERVLSDTTVIVTSDHGHCDVLADRAASVIHLDRLLGDFRQAKLGRRWRARDEVMICPNMRAAQIYVREPSPDVFGNIAAGGLVRFSRGPGHLAYGAATCRPDRVHGCVGARAARVLARDGRRIIVRRPVRRDMGVAGRRRGGRPCPGRPDHPVRRVPERVRATGRSARPSAERRDLDHRQAGV